MTGAYIVLAAAAAYGARETHVARKEQKAATEKAEKEARGIQAEEEALALKEEKTASEKLRRQQQRLLKGKSGRTGLLFGTELGATESNGEPTAQTLGG